MVEMWKFIEGFEDYQVSNYGNVKRTQTDKILSQKTINSGYKRVQLRKNKISYYFLIHRLVAEAFCGNEDKTLNVDHIDRDKNNNHYTNLRFCHHQENCCNKNIQSNNKSGCSGVYYSNSRKGWIAQIKVNQKNIYIGYFKTFEEAKAARLAKEKELFKEFSPNN